jgi:mono/diheme cytochrome c family protein
MPTTSQKSPSAAPLLKGLLGAALLLAAGCDMNDMRERGRVTQHEPSAFFPDGTSSRPPVAGTVARGMANLDDVLHTGKRNGRFVDEFPIPVTRDNILRGQNRFEIYCLPCHGAVGGETDPSKPFFEQGNGMIVQRGFTPPPSYHIERLRTAPAGHFFDVMTNGYGAMYSYAERISVEDRWKIVMYIRALQLSQNAPSDMAEAILEKTASTTQPVTTEHQ